MHDERIAAAITWAHQVLGPVELQVIKLRPWAATWRVERPQAPDLYLKCSTAQTGHEATVLQTLTEVVPDLVPELVAADPAAHRLVVASAGTVLRDLKKIDTFDLTAWVPPVESFARLQRRVAPPHADKLLTQGVPDERPHRYPQMLRDFSTAGQLPAAMRDRLATLADRWETREPRWWRASSIPVSIQHGDLHDGNVAVDAEGRARFFDFGDSTVAHPFTTMDLPLLFARRVGLAPVLRAHNWLRALTPDEPGGTGSSSSTSGSTAGSTVR
ncbi:phosphotransferase [Kineosporia sp. NBRC 101731]|uniref:phosphotransferase n=1 Tax=Kineosporia sp. NBRC 101731 TaxID=3032199 RepID=UPI0024A0C6E8|nr:phosphotransferase [Kineosporia sp. NBRC 101731]GLY33767.1 hypothetical protein Kisp02_71320 [Kineosporia sp. NBRC 101731]